MKLEPISVTAGRLAAVVNVQTITHLDDDDKRLVLTVKAARIRWYLSGLRVPKFVALLYVAFAQPEFNRA